jgi:hypothetical protein
MMRLLSCVIAVGLACNSLLVQAQSADELRFLLFDPVLIEVASNEDGTTRVLELAPPPQDAPVELQQWLVANLPTGSAPDLTPDVTIKRHEQLVQESELNGGPFSAQLPQQLLGLGQALQATGELDKAQQYFEQALHITRINHGLFSDAQIPFVEHSINNQLRLGNLVTADEQQRYLFYLNQKNHGADSTALLPALQHYAEWNIFAFSAPVSAPALAQDQAAAKAPQVDEASFRVERLINAQNIYWSMAQILLANFGMSDPRLLDAEKRIALANYFFATSVAAEADSLSLAGSGLQSQPVAAALAPAPMLGNMGYRQGRDALERRISYIKQMDTISTEERLRASLDLSDWMLYFTRQRMKAIESYDEIHRDFAESMPQDQLDAILNPPLPEPLPTFIKPSWSRAALGLPAELALQYRGYIDVEYRLNRFGKANTVEVLGRSNPEVKLVEQRLLRSLRRAQFRPRMENGELKLSDVVQARYYYTW